MGLGGLPSSHPNFISMPGMHGSYAANMAMYNTDLIIALGVRFDDRVTGRLAAFAPHARVIHVDIDPAEIGKNRAADIPIVGDVKRVLQRMNKFLPELKPECARQKREARMAWWRQIREWKAEHPFVLRRFYEEIKPQHLMAEIDRISGGKAIVTSDVGQHQMWSAQFIRFDEPRLWINSGGLGSMGYRPAVGDRRAIRTARQAGVLHRRRRRLPDVAAGTRDHRELRIADQDHRDEQRLSRHGSAVAGAVLQ